MGTEPLTYEEAARILDPETNLEALRAYAGDCEARQAAIVEACRMGAIALRAMPPSEPLTEEQLREMVGKWVCIVSLDNDSKMTGWAYVGKNRIYTWLGYDCDKYAIRATFGLEECGKEFDAYAYPSAYIDREAWECDACKGSETEDCVESLFMSDSECAAFNFMYCPKCGKPLTPEAWAMLEERLRG